jgi:hypothetical protein
MKNMNQHLIIEQSRACRSKATALRQEVGKDLSGAVAAKMLGIAQQWDDLAEDYETSVLKCVA